ncbi:MAG: ABC-type glycine betaine transport, periplasmic subunit [Thermoanaerobacterales bacterium 50_218]|nr:MAG: ABC-type glycine betaine transport, periplasmic subunit [Thermoanaerobacterales bacterium 50_218]HAA89019.1 ABC transporter substrate-binding protein [Peptococcaceae bacterium]
MLSFRRKKHYFALCVTFLFVGALLLSGCGGGQEQPSVKEKIVFADLSWDSSQVHNRIAGFIVEHGYGYQVDYLMGESVPLLQGLARGDVDVMMEAWVDNYGESYEKVLKEGKIEDLGANFPDAPQGWYVPTYVIKGDPERGIEPMAPDLKSVFDLPKYWQLFKDPEVPNKGRFYNSPPGWVCTEINEAKIKAYGLDKYFNVFGTGSDTALATSIASAYEKGEPWLGYYWEPTWIMGKYDMTLLEEPPYDEERWNEDYGCAYPMCRVHIAVNSKLREKAPEVVEFLQNYETTLEQTNKALAYMRDSGGDAADAAIWFLKQYPQQWKKWVPEDVAAKVEEALKGVK